MKEPSEIWLSYLNTLISTEKDTKIGFKWLNENATILDFENLDDLLTRLVESTEITSEIRELFNRKSAYIFVAAFKAFTKLGREDKEFGEFLHWLIAEGKKIQKSTERLGLN